MREHTTPIQMVATMTLNELGQGAAAVGAILTVAGLGIKWLVVLPIKAYIDHATYPIQPTSNGGNSLPDVIQTLNRIEHKIIELDVRLGHVERDTPSR